VLSSEEVERGKPSPDVYLRACQLLGSQPTLTVAIEDSGAGVRAGRAAGMPVVLIPGTEFPPDPNLLDEADLVLDSIADLSADAVGGLDA
jgi:beta-phosphoglucomutase-like phosphatase (HAD superfamily)